MLAVAELGAVRVRVHGLAHRARDGVLPCFAWLAVVVVEVLVVDVPVNRSDKLQQFTFVVGVPVQKTAEFPQAQVGLFGRNAWFDSGYMLCVRSGCFLKVLTHFPREGGTSDPEVHFVLLSGVSWCGEVCTDASVALPRRLHVEIRTLFCIRPWHLAVICSQSGRFRRGVFGALDDSQL